MRIGVPDLTEALHYVGYRHLGRRALRLDGAQA
jgi:hypothetical protein